MDKLTEGNAKFIKALQESVLTHLHNMAKNQDITTIDELEFRLGKMTERGFHPKFRMPVFRRVINYLVDKYRNTDIRPQEELQLDVSLDSRAHPQLATTLRETRVRLFGLESVRRFCRTNETRIETKRKREDTILQNYDLRIQSSLETPVDPESAERIWDMIRSKKFTKFYRYKKRYSWVANGVRWDLTVVKEASGVSFEMSNVMNQRERYEIEIEYLSPVKIRDEPNQAVSDESLQRMSDKIIETTAESLMNLLEVYQNSFTIISNLRSSQVIKSYKKTVGIPASIDAFFIGMDCTPIESKHLLPDAKTGKMPITEKWATPKADGERHLVYVWDNEVFLIDNRMNVKGTGVASNKNGSIFDAELVELDIGKPAVLLFDTFIYRDDDLRENFSLEIRLGYIGNFLQNLVESEHLEFRRKKYYPLVIPENSEMESPLGWNELVLNGGESGSWGYKLDGIIFTPIGPYPIAKPRKTRRWYELNKWKPVNQLSNDFMVSIRKDVRGKDILYPAPLVSGIDNRQYKALILQSFQVEYNQKIFVKFTGKEPFQDGVDNIAMVPVESDGTIRTREDNHIIYDNSVVEFIREESKWVPLRFREDKTDIQMPNHLDTARSNWELIISPITRNMIIGQEPVPLDYYARIDYNLKALTKNMRNFHNQIKRTMIEACVAKSRELEARYENEPIKLLDIGSGQGGDLRKWMGTDPKAPLIDFVLAIEHNLNNITKAPDGGEERYHKLKKSTKTPMTVEFIWADASKYLNSGSAAHTGAGRDNEATRLQNFFLERGPNWFDCISCQFTFHYFTQTELSMGTVLLNVFQNLRDGGLFFGTTLFGEEVFKQLAPLDLGQSLTGFIGSVKIWEITKNYTEPTLEDIGQEIQVYHSSINGTAIPEYLVNFAHLQKFARKFGLVPITEELNGFKGIGRFNELYSRWANKFPMSDDEKKYSFLNGYFIFQMDTQIANEPENVAFRTSFATTG